MDRKVDVLLTNRECPTSMLMFGSNNYLGLANNQKISESVVDAIGKWGCGVAGPPLLNGYSALIEQLEERLSAAKSQEATLIYSSGYAANVGLVSGLVQKNDTVYYDAYSHSSFIDGLKLSGARGKRFKHNDCESLEKKLARRREKKEGTDTFIAMEGVYSMDGDIGNLPEISKVAKKSDAYLVVDDAHGSGVIGAKGHGVGEHFNMAADIDVLMGTFSKSYSASGGFVSSSKPIVEMLRWFSRAYMFSASPPPTVIATVLAAMNLLENEPGHLERLRSNIKYCSAKLNRLPHGFNTKTDTPIIVLPVPEHVNIRNMNQFYEDSGIFVNTVEYPAVALTDQRFRVSVTAAHLEKDIDHLVEVTDEAWNKFVCV